MNERELPMLAGIGAIVTWCEELLAILSGPILTFGLGIALVALLTDGALLTTAPIFLWVWACSQAVGLDSQFIGSAAKLARAIRRRQWGAVLGYTILCGALGYVGFLASNVFATQQSQGISTSEALAQLGMDGITWILQRSALAVVLVFLAGFLRYVAPAANVALSLEEEKARLLADIELEPLRAQKRAQQARGARGVVDAALGRESMPPPSPAAPLEPPAPPDPTIPPESSTAPSSTQPENTVPAQATTALPRSSTDAESEQAEQVPGASRGRGAGKRAQQTRRKQAEGALRETRQQKAERLLNANPDMSVRALQQELGSSWKLAKRLKQTIQRGRLRVINSIADGNEGDEGDESDLDDERAEVEEEHA